MNKSRIVGILVVALGLAVSCSLKEQAVAEAIIYTDKTGVTVEADADSAIVDTVKITATRSWTISIKTEDGGNWVSVSEKEHINAGEIFQTSNLVLTFSRFKGGSERTAIMTIHGSGCDSPVVMPIVQKAYCPKVSIEAIDDPVGIPASGGECLVMVNSNTKWKASISKEESTVIPNLSLVEGEDTQIIRLEFPANSNDEMAKFAKLVVSAENCTPDSLEFVQSQSERFFFLSSPVDKEILPYKSSVYIPLRSNGPWKATLSECTFENGRIEPAEGLYAYSGIYFNYSKHGEDPFVSGKHALVTISREGMQDISVEFTQNGSIHLNFGHYNPDYEWERKTEDDEYSYKPYTTVTKVFSQPSSFPYSYSSGIYGGIVTDCITSAGGFTFTMYGSDCGLYYVPGSYCFCIGKKKGDYVEFPAFEGYRLSEMYFESSCRNITPYTVRDADGNVIEGGEMTQTIQTVPIYQEYNDMHHHIFPSTKTNLRYRMVLEETLRVISIKDLCIVYEKTE